MIDLNEPVAFFLFVMSIIRVTPLLPECERLPLVIRTDASYLKSIHDLIPIIDRDYPVRIETLKD